MTSDLTSFEHRRRLLFDILYEGPYGNSPLEVNSDFLLNNCFHDFDLETWCHAVGVVYEVNHDPASEFRCSTTLIFYCALSRYETDASEEL